MDEFSVEDTWMRPEKVVELLASSVVENRLLMVLGAGASAGCGLPDWDELVVRAHEVAGIDLTPGVDSSQAAENLSKSLKSASLNFEEVVGQALYTERDSSNRLKPLEAEKVLGNELLSAIAAVVMLSCRRGHGTIVTYNFDDLIETYFAYRGIFAFPYAELPSWFYNEDVSVLHPHGFASRNLLFPSSKNITFTAYDFDGQTGQNTNPWRIRLLELFQSTLPLFIGLSGKDKNLTSVLTEAQNTHVSKSTQRLYWGVRLCVKGDSQIDMWKNRGVWCVELENYGELPKYLMKICKASAELLIKTKLGRGA